MDARRSPSALLRRGPELEADLSSTCGGLTLKDLMIKPIQRVCKYPLFLRDAAKLLGRLPGPAAARVAEVRKKDGRKGVREGGREGRGRAWAARREARAWGAGGAVRLEPP